MRKLNSIILKLVKRNKELYSYVKDRVRDEIIMDIVEQSKKYETATYTDRIENTTLYNCTVVLTPFSTVMNNIFYNKSNEPVMKFYTYENNNTTISNYVEEMLSNAIKKDGNKVTYDEDIINELRNKGIDFKFTDEGIRWNFMI